MNKTAKYLSLTACALAASLFLSGCGGAEGTDTVAPTVAITSAAVGSTVTFTFTFSEALGTGTGDAITAEEITVVGGTAGDFTVVDTTHATLVVTATASTVSVSIAENKFADVSHNFNTVAASSSYAAPKIDFAGTVAFDAFEGLISAAVADDPVVGASNQVAKLVKGPTGELHAGATVYTSGNADSKSVATVDLATNKIVTIRSYTSAPVGTTITLKLENVAAAGENIAAQTLTTAQNAWETLTFNFTSSATGVSTGEFNPAASYNKASLFPAFSIGDKTPNSALAANTSFYFDDLTYTAPTAPTTASTAPTALSAKVLSVFSNGYTNSPMSTFRTAWSDGTLDDFTVGGRTIKKYSNVTFVGMETGANQLDITDYDYVSIDIWSPVITKLGLKLVDFGADAAYDGGDDKGDLQVLTPLTAGTWNTFKIPLSQFTGLATKAHIAQILLATNESVGGVAGTVFMDNFFFGKDTPTQPSAAATAPTVSSSKVLSVFSNGYTNSPMSTFRTVWSNGTLDDFTVGGRTIKKYSNVTFVGMETGANQLDITDYDYVSIDIWSPVITKLGLKLVDFGADAAYDGGDDKGDLQVLTPLTAGTWNTFKIPLSQFTGLATKAHIAQILLATNESVGGVAGTVFMDNFFFGKN